MIGSLPCFHGFRSSSKTHIICVFASMEKNNNARNLVLGYITVFLDVLGYSIVVPILPYLSRSLGASAMQEGCLFSGYCMMQMISWCDCLGSFVGLLIMGTGSDHFGRKPFFILSLIGSCLGEDYGMNVINRSNSSRIIKEHLGSDLLEMSYWFVCWISYCYSSV